MKSDLFPKGGGWSPKGWTFLVNKSGGKWVISSLKLPIFLDLLIKNGALSPFPALYYRMQQINCEGQTKIFLLCKLIYFIDGVKGQNGVKAIRKSRLFVFLSIVIFQATLFRLFGYHEFKVLSSAWGWRSELKGIPSILVHNPPIHHMGNLAFCNKEVVFVSSLKPLLEE